jgi:hypothetical protein
MGPHPKYFPLKLLDSLSMRSYIVLQMFLGVEQCDPGLRCIGTLTPYMSIHVT